MANNKWDLVPVFGVYMSAPGDAPVGGVVSFRLSQRVTRTDGRVIYPDGAKVSVTIGRAEDQDPVVRSAVRAAWRAVDAEAEDFDGTAWDVWWDTTVLPAAIFTGFPAADDPDILPRDWQVTVKETLVGATGREYAIQPLLSQLETPIPGINLGEIAVPPGSPVIATVYMKGIPGGVAALDADGDVVDAAGEKVTGGGSYIGTSDDVTQGSTNLFLTPTERTKISGLSTVASSGAYGDLTGKPSIPSTAADVGAVPTSRTVAGKALSSNVTLVKGDVGLGNVDNTSDAAKPLSTAAVDALAAKADLDGGGKIPTSQLPPLAINETFTAANQTAMLALTAQRGDMAIRTDNGRTYVLSSDSPSTLADWKEVQAAGQVTSVAGKTGTVSLAKADVGLGNVDNTADSAKSFTGTQVAAATTSTRGTIAISTDAAVANGTGTGAVIPTSLAALPAATAEDIPYGETGDSVYDVLTDVLARLDAIEGAGVRITNSVKPSISGTLTVGSTLTVSHGTWSQTPDSYAYQWKRSGSAISGATSQTYVLATDDIGTNKVTCTVTAIKSGFSDGTSTSDPVTVTAAPLAFSVTPVTPTGGFVKVFSGNQLSFSKTDLLDDAVLVAGTKLYVFLYANLNAGASDWSAVTGSGTWTRRGPAWPGTSATNRVFTILEHTVTDPASEPSAWQFTRTGANGRNGGEMYVVQSGTIDAIVTDYLGTTAPPTNGRRVEALTATASGVQLFLATKEGTSSSAQNPTTAPSGFTAISNVAINDGTGTSSQSFMYTYRKDVTAGVQSTYDIAWSAGATNPIAQSVIFKAA